MSFTDTEENAILDERYGTGTLHLALFTVAPTDSTSGTECTGNAYARLAIDNSTLSFTTASGGQIENNETWTIGTPTGGTWGTVVAWGLLTASSGGTLKVYASLTANKATVEDDPVEFAAAALTISVT